ncbi:heavy metal translocating P-type ATPase [Pelorhabdus rhamnosifermentans]|uniref:heavy metal translocating P-type ATPase n=1 Tax=Pelorhabdus rhamnosifermentans TaxID=2772457 RepID=UPI0028A75728|nr:heavy metal translocating P-type ATPase [Pelorhabdus rhamnosifermentans]
MDTTGKFRLIPGRLRIEVDGLRRNSMLADRLKDHLSAVKGIREATANSLTGRLLVLFNYKIIDFLQIKSEINAVVNSYRKIKEFYAREVFVNQAAATVVAAPVVQVKSNPWLYVLTTGGVLAAITAKRITVGRSPLAASQHVFNLAALTTIVSGYPLFRSGLRGLIRHRRINHDLIIFMASLVLLAMRESLTGLSILWLVHLTNLFQFVAQSKSHAHINKIIQQKQRKLLKLENDCRQEIQAHDIKIGDILALHSGERVPVQGQVIAGQAGINCAAVTGNCLPYWVSEGDTVSAGSFIETGSLQIRVLKVSSVSLMPQQYDICKYEENWHISDRYVNKVMWWSLTAAGLIFLFTRDVARSIAVLLAGSPAAISLARSSATGAAIAQATTQKIYVKEPRALETAGEADTVILDKTGTLTEAVPHVVDIAACSTLSENEVLTFAAAAGQRVCYPYSKVLVLEARRRGLQLPAAVSQLVPRMGVRAQIDAEKEVIIGNQLLMMRERILLSRVRAQVARMELNGNTVLYIAVNKKICGLIAVKDKIKAESFESVAALRCVGIENIALLSGDAAAAAETVAATLDIPYKYGGLLPNEKARMIQNLKRQKYKVIMVGDGINDSQALAASDVGIAMGKIGVGPIIHKADIVIGDDDPRKIAKTVILGKKLNEVVTQNIALAAGLNIIGIALAAARFISPLTAGLLVNISTLGVVLNSGRLFTSKQTSVSSDTMDLQRFAMAKSLIKITHESEGEKALLEKKSWHGMSPEAVCEALSTSDKFGISQEEAGRRRSIYGKNVLAARQKPSFWRQLLDQFKDFMVQVLIGAAALSFALGRSKNALLTVGIVSANAFLGVVQERKAGRSLDALQELAAPQARAIRAGRTAKINASALVSGDVIVLEAGDRVPADARLLTTVHFEVEEASLTGETIPVKKQCLSIERAEVSLGDQKNMVFMGTTVTRGRATAVVVATGMNTEMGKIASLLEEHKEEPTPLQRRLEELGRYLVYGCLGVSGLVFFAGILRGETMINMLQTGVTLAVAAIPEGLSAIVLIALAMGVQRMSKRNIIVRKLSSIETLGSATVICSDKTGTLTQNQMTVREVFSLRGQWKVTGEGYNPTGKFSDNNQFVKPNNLLKKIVTIAALCNNAKLMKTEQTQRQVIPLKSCMKAGWTIDGDPTEGALLALAAKAGINIEQLTETHCRVVEYPFESERCMMSVLCTDKSQQSLLYSKGAPDKILSLCTHYTDGEKIYPLDDEMRKKVEQANDAMASKALRVLACAYRPIDVGSHYQEEITVEESLIFCGLVGMIDPPRSEVPEAIAKCRRAGVKVVMITGDHPSTAKAIGTELGLLDDNSRIVTGWEIDKMTDDELIAAVETARIFARTSPHHKLRIIKAFKSRGEVVAMTGDGVNDAPAVKAADIGIAMGMTGTDVTKEAACMTLADDNFATIVRAMEEGRSIYANIRKAIRYLVATNIGEVVLMFLAAILGMPLPLIPIQLLWINLVGDGLPAVALVNDPPPDDVMEQAPQSSSDSVFANGLGRKVMSRGLIIGVSSLLLYVWKLRVSGSIVAARTLTLAQLAISQFMHLFDCRIEKGMGKAELLSNKWLLAAVALSMGMVVGVIQWPLLQPVFGTVSLTPWEWLLAFIVASITSVLDFWVVGKINLKNLSQRPITALSN